jgi:hypothetical protein
MKQDRFSTLWYNLFFACYAGQIKYSTPLASWNLVIFTQKNGDLPDDTNLLG